MGRICCKATQLLAAGTEQLAGNYGATGQVIRVNCNPQSAGPHLLRSQNTPKLRSKKKPCHASECNKVKLDMRVEHAESAEFIPNVNRDDKNEASAM